MGDPLILLKRHGKGSTIVGDMVVFTEGLPNKVELPKSTVTRFRNKKSPTDHYTLDTLWFCAQSSDLTYGKYIMAAKREGFELMALADKTVFDNFMSGTLGAEQLPEEMVEPLEIAAAASMMNVDENAEPSDFLLEGSAVAVVSSFSEPEVVSMVLDRERSVHNAKSLLIAPAKDFKTVLASQFESKEKSHANLSGKPVHDRFKARPEHESHRDMIPGIDDLDTGGSMFIPASRPGPAMTSSRSSGSSSRGVASTSTSSSSRDKRSGGELDHGDTKKAKTGLKPIIVVPGAPSSPINRYNMLKFFAESTFVAIDPLDTTLDDNAPHKVEFMRVKENGDQVPYEVVDTTAKFTPADWERVIAIFTIGKLWQFKAYQPYKEGQIADLFQKHCGFYVRLGSEKIPQDTVAKWKVKIISVSKSHRHEDAASLQEFWDAIDSFVATSKIHHLRT